MATFNAVSTVNAVNVVLWGWATKLVFHTDRSVTGTAARGEVQAAENLGLTAATGTPFTLLV